MNSRASPSSLLDTPLVPVTVDTGPCPVFKISDQHKQSRTVKTGSLPVLRVDSWAEFKEHQVVM